MSVMMLREACFPTCHKIWPHFVQYQLNVLLCELQVPSVGICSQ